MARPPGGRAWTRWPRPHPSLHRSCFPPYKQPEPDNACQKFSRPHAKQTSFLPGTAGHRRAQSSGAYPGRDPYSDPGGARARDPTAASAPGARSPLPRSLAPGARARGELLPQGASGVWSVRSSLRKILRPGASSTWAWRTTWTTPRTFKVPGPSAVGTRSPGGGRLFLTLPSSTRSFLARSHGMGGPGEVRAACFRVCVPFKTGPSREGGGGWGDGPSY